MRARLVLAGLVSLAAWFAAETVAPPEVLTWTGDMEAAAVRMASVLEAVHDARERLGTPIDPVLDPNRTGLIGPVYSELFTTLGQLEAKRTTTQPDMAALLVHLLQSAGIDRGDKVAVGASGSFPALLVATLVAVEAVGAEPVTILSLGASSYGATDPAFDLLATYEVLRSVGVVSVPPAAVSLGGARDVAEDLEPATRERLRERIRAAGVVLLAEPELTPNVTRRMGLHGPVAAFVNVGGAHANVGVSATVLSVRPGLAPDVPLPHGPERGVLQAMAAEGVPVIHLLNVRDLALRHGLPWDPVPLPAPGTARLLRGDGGGSRVTWAVAGAWAICLVLLFVPPISFLRVARTPTLPKETDDVVP